MKEKRRASRRLSFLPSDSSQGSQKMSSKTSAVATQQSQRKISISRLPSNRSISSVNTSSTIQTATSSRIQAAQKSLNAANCLTDDVLQRYRKRMELIRSQSKKGDSNEIFYGKNAGRINLFSEEEAAKDAEQKRQTRSQTSQKNRSGRKVTQDAGMVYVAHTLLNTHNRTPLLPYKPPKDVKFKIRKLVKHATRADWKKIQKFIQKTSNNDESSSSQRSSASAN